MARPIPLDYANQIAKQMREQKVINRELRMNPKLHRSVQHYSKAAVDRFTIKEKKYTWQSSSDTESSHLTGKPSAIEADSIGDTEQEQPLN
jgi:hypothetical protein